MFNLYSNDIFKINYFFIIKFECFIMTNCCIHKYLIFFQLKQVGIEDCFALVIIILFYSGLASFSY